MLSFMFRNLVSLAVFYALPVIQLVITYQAVSASALVFRFTVVTVCTTDT